MTEDLKLSLAREIMGALPIKEFYGDAISPGAKVAGQITKT